MKEITVEQAYALLESCDAVILDQDALIYPQLNGLVGDKDWIFLELYYHNEDDYHYSFKKGTCLPRIDDEDDIVLADAYGIDGRLTLLKKFKAGENND